MEGERKGTTEQGAAGLDGAIGQDTMERQAAEADPEEDISGKKEETGMFESIYDRLPDISIKSLDRFIVLCVVVLVTVILIGVLKAKHLL